MLDALKYFYRPTNQSRIIPIWKQYVLNGKQQQDILKKRYLSEDLYSNQGGNKLLSFILREADIPFLAKFNDDFYVYSTQVIPMVQQFKNIFDLARSGKAYKDMFIKKHSSPPWEYIVPVDDNDWLTIFPMESSFPFWDKLQPLVLWDHDSSEYTLDMMNGVLRFHNQDPSYVLWLLDITTLIMKALKFHQFRKEFTTLPGFENQYTIETFIRHHVTDAIQNNNVHLWYFKLHRLAVNIVLGFETIDKVNELGKRSQGQYGSIGARFKETMDELIDFYTEIQKGSLLPQVILNIKFFHDCTKSFSDICRDIPVYYDIPHLSQYRYLRLLRDLPYLEYMIRVYMLNPKSNQYRNLMVRLYSLSSKWMNEIPFTTIKNINHRAVIKSKLEWMLQLGLDEIKSQ